MMNNKGNIKYYLIISQIWYLCHTMSGLAQVPYDDIYRNEAENYHEQIVLFTDRNMYAVNERIFFRSFYRMNGDMAEDILSKVLYVELVTPSGRTVAKGKFRHGGKGCSGYLTIPVQALTGKYYLRSYTRWMRNYDPRNYCYVPLTIINPFKKDVLDMGDESSAADAERFRMDLQGIQCQISKSSYSPGEEVQLDLCLSPAEYSLPGEYCVTVVPAGLVDTLAAHVNLKVPGTDVNFSFDYLPDIRGVSISGRVVQIEDQLPAPETRLHFSLLGEDPGYFAARSHEMGRFILTVPDRSGIQELFVAGEASDGIKREIRIDQDFASVPVPFGTGPFLLSPEKTKAATRMALNMQLSMAYVQADVDSAASTETGSMVPFYSIPPSKIIIEDYVDLPNMTEVFENLVPEVLVYFRRGEPYLKILSKNTDIIRFPPLILIDQIPVFDQRAVLSMDPLKIERIEVIDEVFVKGKMMFGGIIIFTSGKGDMAAIDLPEGSYFFDYQCFHPGRLIESKDTTGIYQTFDAGSLTDRSGRLNNGDRIPDTRNTLLWIDNVCLDTDEKKTLHFRSAPETGEYHILVRGVSLQGDILYGSGKFKVE